MFLAISGALQSFIWLRSTFLSRLKPADGSLIAFRTSLRAFASTTGAALITIDGAVGALNIGGGGGGGPPNIGGGGGGGGGAGMTVYCFGCSSFLFVFSIKPVTTYLKRACM